MTVYRNRRNILSSVAPNRPGVSNIWKSGAGASVVVAMCLGLAMYVSYVMASLIWNAGQSSVTTHAPIAFHQMLSFMLVYYSIYLSVAIIALAIKNLVFKSLGSIGDAIILTGLLLGSGLFALFYSFQPFLLLLNISFSLLLLWLAKRFFKSYSVAGINFYIVNWLTIAVGLSWGAWFLFSMPVSSITRALLLLTAPLLLITLPSDLLQMFELYDVVCREQWKRPKKSFPRRIYSHERMVSIHVPTYSEPPEMVIETLHKLNQLDYENYEVIVIDNNTKDSALWKPVEEYCKDNWPKFRFIHVADLEGAKGGALNYALKKTNPKAEIIGVIDADYHADPQFLKALVGHFDNSATGFVQTPHDYRGWKGNLFLTMCYWEYKIFFHSAMVGLNERDAGITVGTMCLIRKEALEKAGGWSEWCVTEDSELAIRIHDVGYSSVYVDKTYGRGLIPDTFEAFKKQRYRWTAGPVQEFRHHAKHLVGLSKKPTRFTFTQRIFHLNHGLDNVLLGFNIPFLFISIAVLTSMILHHEIVAVPFELWLAATVMLLTAPLLTLMMYKSTIKPSIKEIIGLRFTSKALSHVIQYAALRTTITGNAAWNRTNKFKSKHSYLEALLSTKEEFLIGVSLAAFIVIAFDMFPYTGFTLMMLIGLAYVSARYFTSPLVGIIGVWSMRKEISKQANAELLVNDLEQAVPDATLA